VGGQMPLIHLVSNYVYDGFDVVANSEVNKLSQD